MDGKTSDDVIQLSQKELDNLIDREARKRLNMSGEDFKRRYKNGELDTCNPAVFDIAILVRLE